MGTKTLTEMVNAVFMRVDENPASDSAIANRSRPEIIRAVDSLNMGYRKVFNRLYGTLRPRVLDAITTAPGVASYAVSGVTDVLKTLHVYPADTPGDLITQSNMGELAQKYGALNSLGRPEYWYRYGNTLSFYPVPGDIRKFIVEGSVKFTELSAPTDVTFFPDEYDQVLQTHAIALEKAFWRDADAQGWMQTFERQLQELHAEALRSAPSMYYRVDIFADDIDGNPEVLV